MHWMFDVGCWTLDVFHRFGGSKRELFRGILSPRGTGGEKPASYPRPSPPWHVFSAQLRLLLERGLQAASPSALSRRSVISQGPWDCATRKRRKRRAPFAGAKALAKTYPPLHAGEGACLVAVCLARQRLLRGFLLLLFCTLQWAAAAASSGGRDDIVKSANLIYAGSKSSVCFSDKFLATVQKETNISADGRFTPVKLSGAELFDYPFAIMTGEGAFTLLEQERKNLKSYLTRGGFLLASAGCSSPDWDRSFRREFKQIFPDKKLKKIPMDHTLFKTIYDIKTIRLKNGGTTQLEGLEMDGKIVLIYSAEGLNDTPNVKGCCCCGGNEIKNCHEINANVFAYCLTH